MKALITESGQYGPFSSITQGVDRWICDGSEYQFNVIGDATIGEYVAPIASEPVPAEVTMRQARLALLANSLLASVEAAITALPSPDKEAATIEWEYAAVVQRNAGLIPAMAAALGMTETQIDDLFIQAAAL